MPQKWLILIAALGGVVGCTAETVEPKAVADTSKPKPGADADVKSDPIDPFYLAIEAERWDVMIDNARGREPVTRAYSLSDEDGRLRIHRALLNGVHNLMLLRNEAFQAGLVDRTTSAALEIPEWAFVFEADLPSLEELQTRSDWLGQAIQPFIGAACQTDAGVWSQECAVE